MFGNIGRKNRKKKELSNIAKELGKRGGDKTMQTYGADHFRKAGRASGTLRYTELGSDYFSKLGKLSAMKRKKKKTPDALRQINELLAGINTIEVKRARKLPDGWEKASSKRAKQIMIMRGEGKSLAEIGREYGITRQRVSMIIKAKTGNVRK